MFRSPVYANHFFDIKNLDTKYCHHFNGQYHSMNKREFVYSFVDIYEFDYTFAWNEKEQDLVTVHP